LRGARRLPQQSDHLVVARLPEILVERPIAANSLGVARQTTSSAWGRRRSIVSGGATGRAA
jgi:hypothetical protein